MKIRFMSFVHPDFQEVSDPNPVPKLVGARNVYPLGIQRAFGLLRDVKMTRSMKNDSRCFVCAGFFKKGNCFCVSTLTVGEFNPINTSSIFDTSLLIIRSRLYTTRSTGALMYS